MDTKTNLVTCGICGHQMVIPPGFEGKPCRCSKCGTPLQTGDHVLSLKLDFDLGPKTSANAQPPTPTRPDLEQRIQWKAAALQTALWGLSGLVAGAIALGLLMGLLAVATTSVHGNFIGHFATAFKGGADFGMLGGFLAGAIIRLMYALEPSIPKGAAIGACVGLAATLVHFVLENQFLAQSDTSALMNGTIGLCGGAALAAMTLWYKQYRESE